MIIIMGKATVMTSIMVEIVISICPVLILEPSILSRSLRFPSKLAFKMIPPQRRHSSGDCGYSVRRYLLL